MNNCDLIKDMLPLYIDDACNEDIKLRVREHLKNCAECKKLYDEMVGELPALDVEIPNAKAINPFKKIKRANMIKTAAITLFAMIIVATAVILITGHSSKNDTISIYCPKNPIVVFEAVLDILESNNASTDAYLVLEDKEGTNIDYENHNYVIFEKAKQQYLNIEYRATSTNNTYNALISRAKDNDHGIKVISVSKLVEILRAIVEKEHVVTNEMGLTMYLCSPEEVTDCDYYYNAITMSFVDAESFNTSLKEGHHICRIVLTGQNNSALSGSPIPVEITVALVEDTV